MKNNLIVLCLISFCCVNALVAQQKKQATGPYTVINGYSGVVTMKKEVLMKAERLTCSVPDYKIISYEVSVKINGAFTNFSCFDDTLSSYAKDIFYAGGKFLIEQVKARKPDGTIVSIRGMTILVE